MRDAYCSCESKPARAAAATRTDGASMCTVVVEGIEEAVFVLDHKTHLLKGGYLNSRNGRFNHTFFRDISEDFGSPANPRYTLVGGVKSLTIPKRPGGVLYVYEETSGKVQAYALTMPTGVRGQQEISPLDEFSFAEE